MMMVPSGGFHGHDKGLDGGPARAGLGAIDADPVAPRRRAREHDGLDPGRGSLAAKIGLETAAIRSYPSNVPGELETI